MFVSIVVAVVAWRARTSNSTYRHVITVPVLRPLMSHNFLSDHDIVTASLQTSSLLNPNAPRPQVDLISTGASLRSHCSRQSRQSLAWEGWARGGSGANTQTSKTRETKNKQINSNTHIATNGLSGALEACTVRRVAGVCRFVHICCCFWHPAQP